MIRVMGDRVLVALPPEPDEIVRPSGLVLVKDPDRKTTPTQGIVVALGEKSGTVRLDDARATVSAFLLDLFQFAPPVTRPVHDAVDRELSEMAPAPFDVAVNDCVLFSRASGEEIEDDGIRYVILHEQEILGVVEPLQKVSA